MDRRTVGIYERGARDWIALRRPRSIDDGRLDAFASLVEAGGRVLDLGCGPAWYAEAFRERGLSSVGLDVAAAMLREARQRVSVVPLVRADLSALPFARASFDAAWGRACYVHLGAGELPAALALAHAALREGAPFWITLANLAAYPATRAEERCGEGERRDDREPFRGRLFAIHTPARARSLLEGAGFADVAVDEQDGFWIWLTARRARTLPDWIRPRLRLLVCGLNPSPYSADAGVPFARPGNRFWPAALRARLLERERDPWAALERGVGFTDCVKRTTARASALRPSEYRSGIRRVEALVRLYPPAATCFVGLDGWRRALDRAARPGWIEGGFGGRPAYLMPSTSGLNAHASLESLTQHLARAASGSSLPRSARRD
jgi:TDG/mug DNA glycosylase family protein